MAVKFTLDQQKVIDTRDKNIVVSAAAGSGKTAVLVERIIKRIMDPVHPIDIDRLLVVTFTNAAAAEMRERIGNAIEKCHYQKSVNIQRILLVCNAFDNTLYQNRRLTGTCCRRYQNVAVTKINDILLFCCPFY